MDRQNIIADECFYGYLTRRGTVSGNGALRVSGSQGELKELR